MPPYGAYSGNRSTIASVSAMNGSGGSGASQTSSENRSSRGKVTSKGPYGASTSATAVASPGHGTRTVTCAGRSLSTPTGSTRPGKGTASANLAIGGFEADEGGADEACGRTELGFRQPHRAAHRLQRLAPHDFLGGLEQVLVRRDAEAAAEDDELRPEDVDERAETRA